MQNVEVDKPEMAHEEAPDGKHFDVLDTLDPEEERRLVRKMDLILLPIMAIGTGLQLVDKSALGSAATLNIVKDLHLKPDEYSWAASIYYFGLLPDPANLLMQRYHTGRVIAIAFLLWGAVMLGTTGVKNFAGLAALRFLLGLFESAMAPGFTTITSRFYTQAEQPLRFSLWTLANTIFPIPFLVIFFGLGQTPDHPLQPWRWIFVLLGAITVCAAVLVWIFLPNTPPDTWWLTPRQREQNTQRLLRSQMGPKDSEVRVYQIFEALTDLKVWLICGLIIFQQSGVSLQTNFSGLIIKGFGFTGLKALLLQIPGWGIASICVVGTGYSVTHFARLRKAKTLILAGFAAVSMSCAVVLYTHPPDHHNKALSLTMLSLLNVNAVGYPIILSLVGQNIAGTTKKQTVLTLLFLSYCISNICVPHAFIKAPYRKGILVVLVFMATHLVVNVSLFLAGKVENGRRDRRSRSTEAEVADDVQDETDKRNPKFRYAF